MFELGRRSENPSEALPAGTQAAASECYRQSAYWGVRALDESASWQALTEEQKTKLAGSAQRLEDLRDQVENGDFRQFWESTREERAHRSAELAKLAQGLLHELAWKTRARDALWVQRLFRIGLLFAVLALAALGVRFALDSSERARDVAAGKPWRVSSVTPGYGCSSPLQACAGSSDYFFHTAEEASPWLELDLGAPTSFTGVRIINRRDCCFERAVPLVVEVSNDGQHYKEVARRTDTFSSWQASFASQRARYVRVRALSRTILHLSQVRVLR